MNKIGAALFLILKLAIVVVIGALLAVFVDCVRIATDMTWPGTATLSFIAAIVFLELSCAVLTGDTL